MRPVLQEGGARPGVGGGPGRLEDGRGDVAQLRAGQAVQAGGQRLHLIFQIVGIDAGRFENPFFDHERVVRHIDAVRRIRGLEQAACVIAYESNYGRDVRFFLPTLQRRVTNFILLNGHVSWAGRGGPGVLTTNETKYAMTMSMATVLRTRSLRCLRRGVCVTPGSSWDAGVDLLAKQLDCWTQHATQGRNGRMTFRFDGKKDGNDDVAFCAMFAYDAHRTFVTFFRQFAEQGAHNELRDPRDPRD